MILANKRGDMIACVLLAEDDCHYVVKCFDEEYQRTVRKDSKSQKLFNTVKDAEHWIRGSV